MDAARFSYARLDGVDLSEAGGIRAEFSGSSMAGARIERSYFVEGDFSGAYMSKVKMRHAVLSDSRFVNCWMPEEMSGCHLGAADLTHAEFKRTDLTGAHLQESNLSGARLEISGVSQSQLNSALADPANPPVIAEGAVDTETGAQLVWVDSPDSETVTTIIEDEYQCTGCGRTARFDRRSASEKEGSFVYCEKCGVREPEREILRGHRRHRAPARFILRDPEAPKFIPREAVGWWQEGFGDVT